MKKPRPLQVERGTGVFGGEILEFAREDGLANVCFELKELGSGPPLIEETIWNVLRSISISQRGHCMLESWTFCTHRATQFSQMICPRNYPLVNTLHVEQRVITNHN